MLNVKKQLPLVSILVCVYNAENFIVTTLDSIIKQKYHNFELLIIDNKSEDKTRTILKKYVKQDKRIKVFYSKNNKGAYGGLNYLLKKAKGKYISILDHDDIWHRNKIYEQIIFLESNDEYVGCGTDCVYYFERTGEIVAPHRIKTSNNFVPHSSLVFRNISLQYDTEVKYKTDTYFMKYILCAVNKRKLYQIRKPLFIYRIRSDQKNLSRTYVKPKNIITYFIKTKDISILVKAITFSLMPNSFKDYIYKKFIFRGVPVDVKGYYKNVIL